MKESIGKAVLIFGDKIVADRLVSEFQCRDLSYLLFPNMETFLFELKANKGSLFFIDSQLTGIPTEKLIELIRTVNKASLIFVFVENHCPDLATGLLASGADDCFTASESIPYVVLKAINHHKKLVSMTAGNIDQGLKLLPEGNMILKQGMKVKLTPTEFKITEALISMEDKVLSRATLIKVLEDEESTQRTIDVHISSLRKKLSELDIEIKTIRSQGYQIILNLASEVA